MKELVPTLHTPHISILVGEDDNVCSCSQAEEIYNTLTRYLSDNVLENRSMHTWRAIEGKHWQFAKDKTGTKRFVDEFIGTIENGAVKNTILATLLVMISLV